MRSTSPSSPPSSRCSRYDATASTPPSSSATSWCPPPPSASAWRSSRAVARWWPGPSAAPTTWPGSGRSSPTPTPGSCSRRSAWSRRSSTPRHPAHRLRRRTVHGGELPRRGGAVARLCPHQGAHAGRSRPLRPAARPAGRHGPGLAAGPGPGGRPAVQLFDSWVGALSPADYERRVLPATRKVFAGLSDLGVVRIHFGVGTGELLGLMATAGAEVLGVDWRVPLDEARRRIGPGHAVQGNLDPTTCLAPWRRGGGAGTRRPGPRGRDRARVQSRPRRAPRDRPRRARARRGPRARCASRARDHATRDAHDAPRRGRHGTRHTALARRPPRLLHRDPTRQPTPTGAARRPRAPVPGHRRDLPSQRAHAGAGRRDPCRPRPARPGPLLCGGGSQVRRPAHRRRRRRARGRRGERPGGPRPHPALLERQRG